MIPTIYQVVCCCASLIWGTYRKRAVQYYTKAALYTWVIRKALQYIGVNTYCTPWYMMREGEPHLVNLPMMLVIVDTMLHKRMLQILITNVHVIFFLKRTACLLELSFKITNLLLTARLKKIDPYYYFDTQIHTHSYSISSLDYQYKQRQSYSNLKVINKTQY